MRFCNLVMWALVASLASLIIPSISGMVQLKLNVKPKLDGLSTLLSSLPNTATIAGNWALPASSLLQNSSLLQKHGVRNVAEEQVATGFEANPAGTAITDHHERIHRVLATELTEDAPPPFTCERLPALDPFTVCSGVVDYEFVSLGDNATTSLNLMNEYAKLYAAGLNGFINEHCLSDMKRFICAQIYLPCVPNGE